MESFIHGIAVTWLSVFLFRDICAGPEDDCRQSTGPGSDRREKKPIPFNPEKIDVRVYYLNTVSEAEDLMAELSKENISVTMEASYEIPDPTGFYAVQVPENGALVIKVGIGKPVLEKVNGRLEITTQVDAGIVLETVNVIGISKVVLPMEATGEQYGNVIYLNNVGVNVPQQIGKNNARMIIQPYVVNNSRNKELTHYLASQGV